MTHQENIKIVSEVAAFIITIFMVIAVVVIGSLAS